VRLEGDGDIAGPGAKVGLMLRAEDLDFVEKGAGSLTGTVVDSLYRGEYLEYIVELSGGAGTVHVHARTDGPTVGHGNAVSLGVNPRKAHVLVN
jgi:ABC-type Fe3+/spermidine/putrescine transport system ATPase subunit